MPKERVGHMGKAYDVKTPKDSQDLYREWASTYDHDLIHNYGYVAPSRVISEFHHHLTSSSHPTKTILDAGCGTGLVAEFISKEYPNVLSCASIDGMDISHEMLQKAKVKNLYANLYQMDLTQKIKHSTRYDAIISVGTFTHGHVGPNGILHLLEIMTSGGILCFSVNEGVWESDKYHEFISDLVERDICRVLRIKKDDYLIETGVQGYIVTLCRT